MAKVKVRIDEIVKVVRGRKVDVLTNGAFWLEAAHTGQTDLIRDTSCETVVHYGEHGICGDEGPDSPHSRP